MELELGLKITQARDSLTADLPITKNGGGIVFLSRETEAMFFLTAHLRGYRSRNIDIKINEDGTRISVIGTKAVQEKVTRGCIIQSNEVELQGFDKVFRIPEDVILDRIKAKFNEEESVLTISMPKSVKGISGSVVEEIVEKGAVNASSEKMDETKQTEQKKSEDRSDRRKKCKVNVPAVAGSALLVSVIVLVINLVRTRQK